MIVCKELDKSFDNKKDLFAALKANKEEIIYFKKAQIQKSFEKNTGVSFKSIDSKKLASVNKSLKIDDNFYYIAVNTTKILDSHSDLHISGIWNRTVNHQQGKNYLVFDHDLSIKSVVVRKEDIEIFVQEIPFSMVGKDYKGNTEALIYKFRKDAIINDLAKNWLDQGNDLEASVRMQYVDLDLALKDDDDPDSKESLLYNKYHPEIANKDDFEKEITYFWVISEAKNVRESSLVIAGSNGATGVLSDESNKGSQKSTSKNNGSADEATRDEVNILELIKTHKI